MRSSWVETSTGEMDARRQTRRGRALLAWMATRPMSSRRPADRSRDARDRFAASGRGDLKGASHRNDSRRRRRERCLPARRREPGESGGRTHSHGRRRVHDRSGEPARAHRGAIGSVEAKTPERNATRSTWCSPRPSATRAPPVRRGWPRSLRMVAMRLTTPSSPCTASRARRRWSHSDPYPTAP